MRKLWRENSLSLFFLALCLVTILGQSLVGQADHNEQAREHGSPELSWGRYLLSSHFGVALVENWESEFLQFALFIVATVWLVQKGSSESKELGKEGLESDDEQKVGEHAEPSSPGWARAGGLRTAIYSQSLLIAMFAIFVASWATQSVTGWNAYNDDQRDHGEPTVTWAGYLGRADFWERTFQNWQSEFLAVGTMAVFSIYLRARGSPESKPVGEARDHTGVTG
jgi:hypothetical protein